MGQVAFNNMPADIRVPLFYAEVNAGTPPFSGISRTVLIGRKLSVGTATIGVPINLGSADPNGLFGPGSMLTDMAVYARYHNTSGEIWALPANDPAGVAATKTITITGNSTASGTLVIYVGGERFAVSVAVGDTPTIVAAAIAANVNLGYWQFGRPMLSTMVATAAVGVCTLTARHNGTMGNFIRVEMGLLSTEVVPAGLTVVIATGVAGTGDVDMTAALAQLGGLQFDWIVAPYANTTQLDAVKVFLSDVGAGRWAPTIALDGHYITFNDGSLSSQTTLGLARNDQHVSILGGRNYPHPPWVWAAALGGQVGLHLNLGAPLSEATELARPLQSLALLGLLPPKLSTDQWGIADLDSLYHSGISGVTFDSDGTARINRIITTYLTNQWGVRDITFLNIETMAICAYVKRYLKSVITSTYPRHVLRDDNPRSLQGVVTPDQAKATIIHAYSDLALVAGIAEKPDLFAQYAIVVRSSDPDRLDCYFPLDFANQLRVFAASIVAFAELNPQIASLQ